MFGFFWCLTPIFAGETCLWSYPYSRSLPSGTFTLAVEHGPFVDALPMQKLLFSRVNCKKLPEGNHDFHILFHIFLIRIYIYIYDYIYI